jgi:ketosteroid isomerase-like protein
MTPEDAIDAVFEAWQALDVERLLPLFTDDARYEDPLFPDALVGHDQLREGVAPAMADLADCAISSRRTVADGDTAMVEAEFRSSLASGDGRLDFDFAMVIEMREGRVARLAEYFDTRPLV